MQVIVLQVADGVDLSKVSVGGSATLTASADVIAATIAGKMVWTNPTAVAATLVDHTHELGSAVAKK